MEAKEQEIAVTAMEAAVAEGVAGRDVTPAGARRERKVDENGNAGFETDENNCW